MLFKKGKEKTKQEPDNQDDIFELPKTEVTPEEKEQIPNFLEPMAKQDESIELRVLFSTLDEPSIFTLNDTVCA